MNPASHRSFAALLCVLVSFGPVRLSAQEPAGGVVSGLWWEVSATAGSARLTCDICDPARELGPSVGVALGAYASDRLRVGVEADAWTNVDGDVRESVDGAGLVAQLHPRPGSGLHVIGGLGWSGYRSEDFGYDAVRLTLGAGWDLPLTESWVTGSRVTLDGSSYGSLNNAGAEVTPSVGLSVLRFGVYLRRR